MRAIVREVIQEKMRKKAMENKEAKTYVTVKIDPEQEEMLDEIMKDYRAPTRAHALRLAIEDRFKEIGGPKT